MIKLGSQAKICTNLQSVKKHDPIEEFSEKWVRDSILRMPDCFSTMTCLSSMTTLRLIFCMNSGSLCTEPSRANLGRCSAKEQVWLFLLPEMRKEDWKQKTGCKKSHRCSSGYPVQDI
ncbi:hypothetical protein BCV72DRAFT_315583 [Rhizopus microsporus var. microsporus]|uniref:Uncharacterized protein n=1 Tax=Rhizopus microsporus var. microsporus TaxID=86635 RepID=A0A1X0QUC6_RHIZD|nr:hypothetical protein BCV72DRAFT_315583 [Rhizopus microsporus var. microsporus]